MVIFAASYPAIGPVAGWLNKATGLAGTGAIVLAVAVTGHIVADGESNWLEGAQLVAVYVIRQWCSTSCRREGGGPRRD